MFDMLWLRWTDTAALIGRWRGQEQSGSREQFLHQGMRGAAQGDGFEAGCYGRGNRTIGCLGNNKRQRSGPKYLCQFVGEVIEQAQFPGSIDIWHMDNQRIEIRSALGPVDFRNGAGIRRIGRQTIDSFGRHSDQSTRLQSLGSGDYRLLLAFAERPGRVLSRDQLLDLTKGREAGPFDRAIDNAVMRLRKKLGEDGNRLIKTVHGAGYSLAAEVSRA